MEYQRKYKAKAPKMELSGIVVIFWDRRYPQLLGK